jgi:hypothetical protein
VLALTLVARVVGARVAVVAILWLTAAYTRRAFVVGSARVVVVAALGIVGELTLTVNAGVGGAGIVVVASPPTTTAVGFLPDTPNLGDILGRIGGGVFARIAGTTRHAK